jgi:hypothetical protein
MTSFSSSLCFQQLLMSSSLVLLLLAALVISSSSLLVVEAANTCSVVTFPNGSKVTFSNPATMMNFWPSLKQTGSVIGNYDWAVSLCNPATQASGAMACAAGNYMSQNPDCSMLFKSAPMMSATTDGTGVIFNFPKTFNNGKTWSALVTCICDLNRNTLYLPSGSYDAQVSGTGQNVIDLTWNFQSKGCCVEGSGPAPGPGGDGNGGDEGGLTWGGVFLIIFFVPSGLYVIGMVAWNYRQGKSGRELAPHPEFWGALPSLAKDGIVFIWCKIRGTPFTPSESGSSETSAGTSAASGGYSTV